MGINVYALTDYPASLEVARQLDFTFLKTQKSIPSLRAGIFILYD